MLVAASCSLGGSDLFFEDDDDISLSPIICGVLASARIKDNTFSDVRIKS